MTSRQTRRFFPGTARFPIKRLQDGRAMLNLACGGRAHHDWNNIDFSPLVRLARHRRLAWILHRLGILSDRRYQRVRASAPDIVCWNLRKGIPFPDDAFDVVYHSHFLEHLTQEAALGLLAECRRVLKPRGLMRVVLPDFPALCTAYLDSYDSLARSMRPSPQELAGHERTFSAVFSQFVAGEPQGTIDQPASVRFFERFVRGSNVDAGEAHRWMYDRVTLRKTLEDSGFTDVRYEAPRSGRIAAWSAFDLDTNGDGRPHQPMSLYAEALKPAENSGCGSHEG